MLTGLGIRANLNFRNPPFWDLRNDHSSVTFKFCNAAAPTNPTPSPKNETYRISYTDFGGLLGIDAFLAQTFPQHHPDVTSTLQ